MSISNIKQQLIRTYWSLPSYQVFCVSRDFRLNKLQPCGKNRNLGFLNLTYIIYLSCLGQNTYTERYSLCQNFCFTQLIRLTGIVEYHTIYRCCDMGWPQIIICNRVYFRKMPKMRNLCNGFICGPYLLWAESVHRNDYNPPPLKQS